MSFRANRLPAGNAVRRLANQSAAQARPEPHGQHRSPQRMNAAREAIHLAGNDDQARQEGEAALAEAHGDLSLAMGLSSFPSAGGRCGSSDGSADTGSPGPTGRSPGADTNGTAGGWMVQVRLVTAIGVDCDCRMRRRRRSVRTLRPTHRGRGRVGASPATSARPPSSSTDRNRKMAIWVTDGDAERYPER